MRCKLIEENMEKEEVNVLIFKSENFIERYLEIFEKDWDDALE